MGGSQSVRKITIENNSADVIKVSQSVVERLRNSSKMDVSNEDKSQETVKPNVVPAVAPTFGNFSPYAYAYSIGSIPVQEEIHKEVEKANQYWKGRVTKLESNQDDMNKRMQDEFEKTMQQFEKVLPELNAARTKKGDLHDLNESKERLIKCYKEHKDRSLNCAAEVENFHRCFEATRNQQRQVS